MPEHRTIVIVGGGITGLAAAYQLTQDDIRDFLLVEEETRLGGKIATARVKGFLVEGGPDSFVTFKPGALELCRELGLGERLVAAVPRRRGSLVKRDGRLHPLPAGLTSLVPSRVMPLITTRTVSIAGRLRAALELFVPRRREKLDESVAAFTKRRFGREVYDWLVEPLLAGIHAADGAALSVAATFPNLLDFERRHGGVLRAMLLPRLSRSAAAGTSPFMTPVRGAGEIVEAVARVLPTANVRTGVSVRMIERSGERYRVHLADGTRVEADRLIVTAPAHAASRMLAPLDRMLAAALATIPFVSTATVSLGYRASDVPHALDAHGYLSPRAAGGPVVACTWASSKFEGRAPEGHALLRVFVGRAGMDDVVRVGQGALEEVARDELRQTLGITAAPVVSRVYRWVDGIPQYTVGHLDRVAAINDCAARYPGLWLVGSSYRGAGLPDCIDAGRRAARAATASA